MFTDIVMINYARPLPERRNARKSCGPYHWTPTNAPSKGRGFYQDCKSLKMDAHGSTFALRLEEANDLLPSHSRTRGTTAYWCDDDGFSTLTPIVARLPKGRGFLAGWTMGNGMCASLDSDIIEDAESAAYAAHSVARSTAEDMLADYDASEPEDDEDEV